MQYEKKFLADPAEDTWARRETRIGYHDDEKIVHLMQSGLMMDLASVTWPVAATPAIVDHLIDIYEVTTGKRFRRHRASNALGDRI